MGKFRERNFVERFSAVGKFFARMCETCLRLLQWVITMANILLVLFRANGQVT